MSMKANIPDSITHEERRELLRQLLEEELNTVTYETPDSEFNPDIVFALTTLLDDLTPNQEKARSAEVLPEEFLKRFNYIHSRDSMYNALNKGQEVMKKTAKKPLNKRLLKLATAAVVLVCTFGAVNVITYASAKQSVFQLIEETISSIRFKINPVEELRERPLEEGDYVAEIEAVEYVTINQEEIPKYFFNEVYLPQWMPENLADLSVKRSPVINGKVSLNFFSKEYDQYLALSIIESTDVITEMTVVYDANNVKLEKVVTIGDSQEFLYIAESDGLSMAYIILHDVMYLFRYTFDTEQFIKIVESMEVYK